MTERVMSGSNLEAGGAGGKVATRMLVDLSQSGRVEAFDWVRGALYWHLATVCEREDGFVQRTADR